MPSHPRFLSLIRAAVGELGLACGLPEKDCRGVILAVDEALANIIRHAYHGDADRQIELNCRARTDRLEFTLLDQGNPPDPRRLAPNPPNDEALGGRGVYIIKTIMDEVSYERLPGGNQVRLTKWLPTAGTCAEGAEEDI